MPLQVCQLANYLKSIGVKRGSDVTIYMPMIPELPAAMVKPMSTLGDAMCPYYRDNLRHKLGWSCARH